MGGGGGTDYAAQAKQEEATKQAARDAVNLQFGIAPTSGAPSASSYPTTVAHTAHGAPISGPDGSAYQTALDAYNAENTTATTNAAARDAIYQGVRNDAFTAGKTSLDDTHTSASRNNKFALFAQGLNGGSEDIDENALLDRTYSQGLLDLGAKADAAESGLKANDETTRLGLLQSIDNGMDQGSALTSALQQMTNNASSAAANAQGTDLGDLFATSGALYTKSNAARGASDATAYLNSLFGGAGLSGGKNSGIVTRT